MLQLRPEKSQRTSTMTTIQLTLPDDLAKKAKEAGLFSADAIQEMLWEQLLRRAGELLREIRSRLPREEMTPEIEQEIADAPRSASCRRRRCGRRPRNRCAVAARVQYIVTGDRTHLLPIGTYGDIAIISPRQCLDLLGP